MQRQISKLCPWLVLVLAAALGCGGKSQVRAGDRENEAGAHFGGSPGAGASAGTGGRPGTGGSGTAAASSSGGSAAAGNGGAAPFDKCTLPPPELRSCEGSPFFFYNVHTGQCVPVDGMRCPDDYEGIFASLAECLATCPWAEPAADACDTASDCIVAQPGCCSGCEPIEESQLRAVHHSRRDILGNDCDVACGACSQVTELQRTSQYFVPSCDQGQCVVTDLRRTTATECDADDDCTLRDGSACCEGCDGAGLVALSSAETITATCSDDLACDACAAPIPSIFEAGCDASGRCVVIGISTRKCACKPNSFGESEYTCTD